MFQLLHLEEKLPIRFVSHLSVGLWGWGQRGEDGHQGTEGEGELHQASLLLGGFHRGLPLPLCVGYPDLSDCQGVLTAGLGLGQVRFLVRDKPGIHQVIQKTCKDVFHQKKHKIWELHFLFFKYKIIIIIYTLITSYRHNQFKQYIF